MRVPRGRSPPCTPYPLLKSLGGRRSGCSNGGQTWRLKGARRTVTEGDHGTERFARGDQPATEGIRLNCECGVVLGGFISRSTGPGLDRRGDMAAGGLGVRAAPTRLRTRALAAFPRCREYIDLHPRQQSLHFRDGSGTRTYSQYAWRRRLVGAVETRIGSRARVPKSWLIGGGSNGEVVFRCASRPRCQASADGPERS